MAGDCVEKMGHSCGTHQGLQVFLNEDGTYSGFCFSCNKYVADPYKDKPKGYKPVAVKKTAEEIEAEIAEIKDMGTQDIPERMLMKKYLEYFGVKVGYDERVAGKVNFMAFPYNQGKGFKCNLLSPKKFWSVGDASGSDFFGLDKALQTGAKRLYITEGEKDAVTLFQVMKESNNNPKFADFNPAVVSLPHGIASATADISTKIEVFRKHFKEIVLVFDMDAPGRAGAADVCRVYPDFLSVDLPAKDPNECLMQGFKKGLFNAVMFNAEKPKNSRLVFGSSLRESAMKAPEWGLSWPWQGLTDLTRGIRRGETYYLGAGVKMGQLIVSY